MLILAVLVIVVALLQLASLEFQRRILMSTTSAQQALADLTAAISSLQGSVSALQTADAAIDAAIAGLSGQGVSPAAIEAAVAQLTAASAAIKPIVSDLTTQTGNLTNPPTGITVSVSPTSAGPVAQGSTQQFTATVTGDPANAGVNWTTSAGTVDQTGLFTPPTPGGGSATVTATSVSDPTKSASATVTF